MVLIPPQEVEHNEQHLISTP